MKTSEQRIMFIIFHHGSSFFYHLESLFLSHVASKDSAQTFASGPENIDERRKGHCGNSSFQQWPFRQRYPERFALFWWLLIFVDCWCHSFAAATLKWGDLLYARGWWTSVYHLFCVFTRVPGLWPIPIWRFPKIGIRWFHGFQGVPMDHPREFAEQTWKHHFQQPPASLKFMPQYPFDT